MRVVPIDDKLARVDGWWRERYAARTPHGWCWDVTGRAVCPVTASAIQRAVAALSTPSPTA